MKMYILVNEDIKISKGKLAGQVGHAVNSFLWYEYIVPLQQGIAVESLEEYMVAQKKIILKCSQSKLEELEQQGYITIRDKGLTELEPNTLTCVNVGIYYDEYTPQWIKELKLYH